MGKELHHILNEIFGSCPGRDIAKRIRKSPACVSQIRSGELVPSFETLAAVATEFGVPHRLSELITAADVSRLHSERFKQDSSGSLKKAVAAALEELSVAAHPRGSVCKLSGRTLLDFPDSFYPLAVITGDSREDRGSKISVGDLGVYAATPGDSRWILNLGLRPDVIKHIDKNFVLLSEDELIKDFAEVNLLIVGSPASNHLARIVNSSALFRFNYSRDIEQAITDVITRASGFSTVQLVAYRDQESSRLVAKMRSLFAGGIFDPTHPDADYVAATYAQLAMNTQLDFGVLTFGANPYYVRKCKLEGRKCDHKYVSIMSAGIHHPATAHALHLLGQDCRREGVFDKHPYGGVIRVELDLSVPFATRTMKASCQWEDVADKARKPSDNQKKLLLEQFEVIETKLGRRELKNLALTDGQAAECHKLIETL